MWIKSSGLWIQSRQIYDFVKIKWPFVFSSITLTVTQFLFRINSIYFRVKACLSSLLIHKKLIKFTNHPFWKCSYMCNDVIRLCQLLCYFKKISDLCELNVYDEHETNWGIFLAHCESYTLTSSSFLDFIDAIQIRYIQMFLFLKTSISLHWLNKLWFV